MNEFALEALGHIDPALVEEIDLTGPKKRRLSPRLRAALIAACACLVLLGTGATAVYHLTTQVFHNKEHTGYVVYGELAQFPLSDLSPELLSASEERDSPLASVSRSFDTWDEVQTFLGASIPCVIPNGWEGTFQVLLWHRQFDLDQTDPDGRLYGIRIYSSVEAANLSIFFETENMTERLGIVAELDDDPACTMELQDSYLMANGTTAEVVLRTASEQKNCAYHGIFVKDGISYRVDTFGTLANQEAALTRFKMILDGFS